MAEDDRDRRIEPREGVVGKGMLTDPDRIRQIEEEAARRERAWREPPKVGFGEVMSKTPAKAQEQTDVYVPAPSRKAKAGAPEGVQDEDEGEAGDGGEGELAAEAETPVPRVPPDPRMAMLNRMLDAKKPGASSSQASGTPSSSAPAGPPKRKP